MARRGSPHSPKLQDIRFSVISRALIGQSGLPLCRNAVNVFYSLSQLWFVYLSLYYCYFIHLIKTRGSQIPPQLNFWSLFCYCSMFVAVALLKKEWFLLGVRLSVIWKSDLTDKMKRSFFQAAVVLILLYGCTTWALTKRIEKKLDCNYTRMLQAILNKSWRQHPTKQQLYGHHHENYQN